MILCSSARVPLPMFGLLRRSSKRKAARDWLTEAIRYSAWLLGGMGGRLGNGFWVRVGLWVVDWALDWDNGWTWGWGWEWDPTFSSPKEKTVSGL